MALCQFNNILPDSFLHQNNTSLDHSESIRRPRTCCKRCLHFHNCYVYRLLPYSNHKNRHLQPNKCVLGPQCPRELSQPVQTVPCRHFPCYSYRPVHSHHTDTAYLVVANLAEQEDQDCCVTGRWWYWNRRRDLPTSCCHPLCKHIGCKLWIRCPSCHDVRTPLQEWGPLY